ncbi:hypothetical protein EKK58_07220 [Candidatus Dependentiae bacterium]|nr:MAG: hypothetical protein EKK58_07220 [Candidatus Dependentiae bacterium]
MIKKKIYYLFFITVTVGLPSYAEIASVRQYKQEDNWITVFVHGIMSIKPHLTVGNFYRFMNDKVINTPYAKEAEYIRLDPYFQMTQAMQELGLHEINIEQYPIKNASQAAGSIFDKVSQKYYPSRKNRYYTFGWSGLLSPTQRYHDAHELFLALENLIQTVEYEHGYRPKIRLIGYSHGGNVILNLAAIKRDYYRSSVLTVDELVLIGVPLVTETDFLVTDSMFKKTYHIFSEQDRIQRIDFFSFNRLFSRKKFTGRKGFSLPDNLIQINIKLMKPTESKRASKKHIQTLRHDLSNPSIISGNHPLLRNVSAGHIELWFFGWTPQHYRPHFVLAPLPVMVFVPYIIHSIEHMAPYINNQKIVTLDIRPKDNLTLVKQKGKKAWHHAIPFFNPQELATLNAIAESVRPELYTNDLFNEHIKQACKKANEYYNKHIKPFNNYKIVPSIDIRLRKRRTIKE